MTDSNYDSGADDFNFDEICPKDAIEEKAQSACPKDRIDADVKDICPKERIAEAASSVCTKRQIDEKASKLCNASISPMIGIVPTQMPQEHIFRVNDYYINSIILSGGIPLILPLTYDKSVYERLIPICDGFVLTGGQDVDPERYGVSPKHEAYLKLGEITPMRDRVENLILDFANQFDVPVFGICRGMQTMNVHFGGTLYVDVPQQFSGVDKLSKMPIVHWQEEEPVEAAHYIDISRGSRLHEILAVDSSAANSFHHQAVKKVADGFKAVAFASDGLIEAIESKKHSFMLGVQWHPEFFLGDKHMGNLFTALVNEASLARESGRLDNTSSFEIGSFIDDDKDEGRSRALVHGIQRRYAV